MISVPDRLIEAIYSFRDADIADAKDLYSRFTNQNETIFPEEFRKLAKFIFMDDQEKRSDFLAHMLSAPEYFYDHRVELQAADVLSQVKQKHGENLDAQQLEVIELFINILMSDGAFLTSRVYSLSYRHTDIVHESNIVVDARPVFDLSNEEIKTYVVLAQLQLNLHRHSEPDFLSLYLDKRDIEELKEVCEKALVQIDRASKVLVESSKQPVYVPGAENEE